jgi:hypothetical protein
MYEIRLYNIVNMNQKKKKKLWNWPCENILVLGNFHFFLKITDFDLVNKIFKLTQVFGFFFHFRKNQTEF